MPTAKSKKNKRRTIVYSQSDRIKQLKIKILAKLCGRTFSELIDILIEPYYDFITQVLTSEGFITEYGSINTTEFDEQVHDLDEIVDKIVEHYDGIDKTTYLDLMKQYQDDKVFIYKKENGEEVKITEVNFGRILRISRLH